MCIKIKKYSFEFIRLQSFVTKTPHSNQLPAATVNYTKTKCFVFGSLRKNIWKLVLWLAFVLGKPFLHH